MKMRYLLLFVAGIFTSLSVSAQEPKTVIYEDLQKLPKGSYVQFTDTLTLSAHSTMESLNCAGDQTDGLPYDVQVLYKKSNKMQQITKEQEFKIKGSYLSEPDRESLILELKKNLLLKIPYEGRYGMRSTIDLWEKCGDRLYIKIEKIKKVKKIQL